MFCPFCQLEDRPIVAQNDLALAFYDAYPVNPGHTLIVPRRHVESWFDATKVFNMLTTSAMFTHT